MDKLIRIELAAGNVLVDGAIVPLRPRELEILVLLGIRRNPIGAAVAADLLYSRDRIEDARALLKVHVHRARARLGRAAIVCERGCYRLGSNVHLDVIELSNLVSALTPRVNDLQQADRTMLERAALQLRKVCPEPLLACDWFAPFHETLVQTGCEVLALLGWAAIKRKAFDEALRLAGDALREDPCDERALEIAVHAYAGLGRPGSAISEFRGYSRRVREELGIDPSLELATAFRDAMVS